MNLYVLHVICTVKIQYENGPVFKIYLMTRIFDMIIFQCSYTR